MEDINRKIVLELELNDNDFKFISSIGEAKREAKKELDEINKSIIDNEDTIRMLTPECDKIDYILALCSGTICGIIDVFLGNSPAILCIFVISKASSKFKSGNIDGIRLAIIVLP